MHAKDTICGTIRHYFKDPAGVANGPSLGYQLKGQGGDFHPKPLLSRLLLLETDTRYLRRSKDGLGDCRIIHFFLLPSQRVFRCDPALVDKQPQLTQARVMAPWPTR